MDDEKLIEGMERDLKNAVAYGKAFDSMIRQCFPTLAACCGCGGRPVKEAGLCEFCVDKAWMRS